MKVFKKVKTIQLHITMKYINEIKNKENKLT